MTALEEWHHRFDQMDIRSANVEDVCIALRQDIRIDDVVPMAIAMLEADPMAGFLYDGEILVALLSVPANFWGLNPAKAVNLKRLIQRLPDVTDQRLKEDVMRLAERLP